MVARGGVNSGGRGSSLPTFFRFRSEPPLDTTATVSPLKKWEPLPERLKVGIFRFPFDMKESSTTVDWLARSLHYLNNHDRIDLTVTEAIADTPVDMSRNRALKHAQEHGLHLAIFIDSDMWPDYEWVHNKGAVVEGQTQFLPAAFEFALAHNGPCVVAAPYCTAPPEERVLVMKWTTTETGGPPGTAVIKAVDRGEAALRRGFEEVAALGTGLMLIDMRALQLLPTPWFAYEWKDPEHTEKASTEDIVFTRDLHLLGVPQYVFWDAWAGHWKTKMVTRPAMIPLEKVSVAMRKVLWEKFNVEMNRQLGVGEA